MASRNTTNLPQRLAVDFAAATCAGALVAPVVASIDRAIMENASGRAPLWASLTSSLRTFLLRPHHFLASRPFLLVFALYSGTYISANALDTALSTLNAAPASTVTAGPSKFLATSAANLGLCLRKDSAFARMFGDPRALTRTIPLATYALFAARDALTVSASFNLPPRIAPYIDASFGQAVRRHIDAESLAQFIAPAALQIASTPLHLLGLDLYNRPEGISASQRWGKVRKDWAVSCIARMCRIIPAFGFGGVVNMKVRRRLMEKLE